MELRPQKPPPALAAKLGITPATHLRVLGTIDDPSLASALETARALVTEGAEFHLAQLETPEDLMRVLRQVTAPGLSRVPLWLIFPRGSRQPLTEALIRSTLRESGFMDPGSPPSPPGSPPSASILKKLTCVIKPPRQPYIGPQRTTQFTTFSRIVRAKSSSRNPMKPAKTGSKTQ